MVMMVILMKKNNVIISDDKMKEDYIKLASFLRDFQLSRYKDQNKCINNILKAVNDYELSKSRIREKPIDVI